MDDDDDEYEIEYVYEDDDDDETGEPVYGINEGVAYELEFDNENENLPTGQLNFQLDDNNEEMKEEVVVDEEEYNRIANKIDELLDKTNSLRMNSDIIEVPNTVANIESLVESIIQNEQNVTSESNNNIDNTKESHSSTNCKLSSPVERASTVEEINASAPMEGQLRHVHNQWNISDLKDEEAISETKG